MKKILLFVLVVALLAGPKIQTAMVTNGAGEELFGSLTKKALLLLALLSLFRLIRLVFSLMCAVVAFVFGLGGGKRARYEDDAAIDRDLAY